MFIWSDRQTVLTFFFIHIEVALFTSFFKCIGQEEWFIDIKEQLLSLTSCCLCAMVDVSYDLYNLVWVGFRWAISSKLICLPLEACSFV